MTSPAPIAFLGLGRMGAPMSLNLARAGFAVRAWNRSPRGGMASDADYLITDTPADAAAGASIILTMLPDLGEVEQVCAGPAGVFASAATGAIVVVLGTVSPVRIQRWGADVARLGFRVVDAPVSGGDVGAHDGTLSIMVGGSERDVADVRAALQSMGSVVRHLGPLGAGQLAKACNQIVVGATLTALGEAITLGARSGLDVAALIDVLGAGLAGSRALEVKRQMLIDHSFVAGGRAALQHKDLGFALEAGRAASVTLPLTAVVEQLYGAMCSTGRGDLDHSGIMTIVEMLSSPAD